MGIECDRLAEDLFSFAQLAPHAFELSLAVSSDRAAVAWHGGAAGKDAIFLQALDSKAQPVGAPMQITDSARFAYEPDLQWFDDDMVLTWYEKDASSGALTAWLARIDFGGHIQWRRQLNAELGEARNPVVRVSGREIRIAWIEAATSAPPTVWVAQFAEDGLPLEPFRRAGAASSNTWNLNAATDAAGKFYVVYDARLGTRANELSLLVIDDRGIKAVTLSSNDGFASVYPDIAFGAGGQAALTWFDDRDGNDEIYLAVLPVADLVEGKALREKRLTFTPGHSLGAYLAWNNDALRLVWCDDDPGQLELFTQGFDAAGQDVGDIERLTTTPSQSSIPSISPWKNGFLVAWNEYRAAGGADHDLISASRAVIEPISNSDRRHNR